MAIICFSTANLLKNSHNRLDIVLSDKSDKSEAPISPTPNNNQGGRQASCSKPSASGIFSGLIIRSGIISHR